MTSPLFFTRHLLADAIAHAVAEAPDECCGLFAGRDGVVTHRFQLVNAAASPTRFESSPESMFAAMREMRLLGIDILAVYHSHPASSAIPSRTDRELNYAGDVATVIISLATDPPQVGVWRLEGDHFVAVDWSAD